MAFGIVSKKGLVNKVGIGSNEIAGFEKEKGRLNKYFNNEKKVRLLVEYTKEKRIASLKASQPSNPEMGFIEPSSHLIKAGEYAEKADKLRFQLIVTYDREKLDRIENEIEELLNHARTQLNIALFKKVDRRSSLARTVRGLIESINDDRKSARDSYNKTLGEIEAKKDREEAFEELVQHVFDKLKANKPEQVGDEALKAAIRKNLALMKLQKLGGYIELEGEEKELFGSFVMKDAENPDKKEKERSMGCC